MGYFDESSDDEEQKPQKAPYDQQRKRYDQQYDEEDPLDAFMKTLNNEVSADPPQKRIRLDLQEEQEGQPIEEDTRKLCSQHKINYSTEPFRKNFWDIIRTENGFKWREVHKVSISEPFDPILNFEELKEIASPKLLEEISFSKPTIVQSQSLPVILSGRDALIGAATGQGKTFAYLWPACIHIRYSNVKDHPVALVLVPTRELAQQVASHKLDCRTITLIGGQEKQFWKQKRVDLIVATPGRLLDEAKKDLAYITFVVIDECDKMLSMGFVSQVEEILGRLRPDRQTVLLSATLRRKQNQWLKSDYVSIQVGPGECENVEQEVVIVPHRQAKIQFVQSLVEAGTTLVFVATREECEIVGSTLGAATLHGDQHQTTRNSALRDFRKGKISMLIATDIASRGLDIANIQTVVSMDAPRSWEQHIHRVGRAGRLGQKAGMVYILVTRKEQKFVRQLIDHWERDGRSISPQLRDLVRT